MLVKIICLVCSASHKHAESGEGPWFFACMCFLLRLIWYLVFFHTLVPSSLFPPPLNLLKFFWDWLRLCLLLHICLLVLPCVWSDRTRQRRRVDRAQHFSELFTLKNLWRWGIFVCTPNPLKYTIWKQNEVPRNENWIMPCEICFVTWIHESNMAKPHKIIYFFLFIFSRPWITIVSVIWRYIIYNHL